MNPRSTSTLVRGRRTPLAVLFAMAVVVAACGSTAESTTGELPAEESSVDATTEQTHAFGASLDEFLETDGEKPASAPPPDGFEEIEWEDLVPPGSTPADISAKFDERIAAVVPGSPEANEVFAELQAEYDNQPVNPDLAGEAIQLAGFVAPLTYSGELVTEFLLVPYFGACIHVPPPPVNQTVLVSLREGEGLTIDESWGAVWVSGTLTVDGAETDLATAGYTISDAQTGAYDGY